MLSYWGMDPLLGLLEIWRTDRELRRQSRFGQSDMEKRNGVWVGVLCVSLMVLIVVLWLWIGG